MILLALQIGTASADIDHLVLGPERIFTISTKHHSGNKIWIASRSFLVNCQKYTYVRNCRFEATHVTKVLRRRAHQPPLLQAVIALVSSGNSHRTMNTRDRGCLVNGRRCWPYFRSAVTAALIYGPVKLAVS